MNLLRNPKKSKLNLNERKKKQSDGNECASSDKLQTF